MKPAFHNKSKRYHRLGTKSTLIRLLSYQKQHWPHALALALATGGISVFTLLQPWVLGFYLVGDVLIKKNLELLPWVILLLLASYGGKEIAGYFQAYFSQTLSAKTMHRIRYELFLHLEKLPVTYFDNSRTGELIARIISDTDEVEKVMTQGISGNGTDLTTIIGTFILLFYVNPGLAMYVVPVAASLVITVLLFRKPLKRSSRIIRQTVGELGAKANEVIASIRVVKSFSMEKSEADQFFNKSLGISEAKIRLAKRSGFYSGAVDMLAGLAIVVVVFFAAPQVVHGYLALGALVAFIGLVDKLVKPITSVSKANVDIQRAVVAGERIFDIMDREPETTIGMNIQTTATTETNSTLIDPAKMKLEIRFDNVSFGYDPNTKILENFNLLIPAGQTVAIVGKSGAGKSTLVNLLLRFYEPSSGKIFIDNSPIDRLSLAQLRQKIAIVLQDPVLFSDTIRNNIAYGKPDASNSEIIEAAKAANAHEFILALREGYNSQIGERGVKLSTGQRQRIAIARALLKNPSIIILDEATSNVDSQSEALIKDTLNRLAKEKTTIVISHRLSTVVNSNKIIVLENGEIVEMGDHFELLRKGGTYAMLYDAQIHSA